MEEINMNKKNIRRKTAYQREFWYLILSTHSQNRYVNKKIKIILI